jgi:hypothetical protein
MKAFHRIVRLGRLACLGLAACAAVTTACLSGFERPLAPVGDSFIDGVLLGAWVCTSSDDDRPIDLNFVKFDNRQYLLLSDDHEAEVNHHRVLGSRLESATFLSLRSIAPTAEDQWTVLQYSLDEAERLFLKVVDAQAFADVVDDPQGIRDRLAGHLDDPEVIRELLSCERPEPSCSPPES